MTATIVTSHAEVYASGCPKAQQEWLLLDLMDHGVAAHELGPGEFGPETRVRVDPKRIAKVGNEWRVK